MIKVVVTLKIEVPFELDVHEVENRIKENFFHDILPEINDYMIIESSWRYAKREDEGLFEEV